MIVLWKTNYGLYCIPMFTFSGVISVNHLDKDRVGELVTMVTEDKRDKIIDHTAWAGLPLIMNLNPSMLGAAPSQIAYADLSRPYWVGKTEQITDKVGSLDGDEYLRLVCLFEQKQKTWIENSFKEFGVDYINVPSITPTPLSDGRTDRDYGPNIMVMADHVFNGQYNSKFKVQRIKKKHDEAAKNRGVVKK
ncbi:hypothetical protein D6D08_10452 [Aureobasidium pullulans]|nr:hypothetical protein D6D08_10452 [Aureobasidium pullulans]